MSPSPGSPGLDTPVSSDRRRGGPAGKDVWDGLVVLCAANNWDGVKLADQHMAEQLSRHVPVLYVDPPMSHLTPRHQPELAGALHGPRLRTLGPGLARLTPLMTPKGQHRLLAPVTTRLLAAQVRHAVRRLGATVRAMVVTNPSWLSLGVCDEELSIFWAQDDFVGLADLLGLGVARIDRAERSAAAAADLIVTSSPAVTDTWSNRGYQPIMIPFGCDAAHLAGPPRPSALPDGLEPPVAGFVGHINERTDLSLLEAVSSSGLSLLLVGPLDPNFEPARVGELLGRPNVRWLGPQPFAELPALLAAMTVGLVPYNQSAFNLGSFPLKTLEYLAAGLPVVATDLPSTRWFNTDLVTIADSPDDYVRAARAAARLRDDPELVRRRKAFASGHDWSHRAEQLAALIRDPAAR